MPNTKMYFDDSISSNGHFIKEYFQNTVVSKDPLIWEILDAKIDFIDNVSSSAHDKKNWDNPFTGLGTPPDFFIDFFNLLQTQPK